MPVLSPDGNRVAFSAKGRTEIFVGNLDGTDRRKISSTHDLAGLSAWSPDGTRVAFAVGDMAAGFKSDLREAAVAGGEETILSEQRWSQMTGVVWAPDGKRLIVVGTDGWKHAPRALWEVSYPAGRVRRITTDLGRYDRVSISADGLKLATVRLVSHSKLWIVSTAEDVPPKQILSGSGQTDYFGVNWTPDGRILYGSNASGNADCWIMDADGSNARRLISDPAADYSPVATPDGESIVFVSNRSGGNNLWTMRLDGSSPQQLTRGGQDTQPDVSPDGRWVVYNCGRVPTAVCRIPIDGGDAEKLSQDQDTQWKTDPAISPDGSRIAYFTADRETEIISIDGGPVLASYDFWDGGDWKVQRWTSDGRHLTAAGDFYDDGIYNIWTQPIGGGNPMQRTFLDLPDEIRAFAWSPDGTLLLIATGGESSEVVLLEGF